MLPSLIRRCAQSVYKPVVFSHRSGRRLKERMTAAAEKKEKSGGASGKLVLKTAKGTRDYTPRDMALRKKVLGIVTEVFEQFDAESIDTPIFERREILMGKYGEEGGKLVYDLDDQGGEILSMRYDLTVPFARYCAMNKVNALKRYHIGKVYRRDQPVMTRGRYREFYQCDYDIAGQYDSMLPESECLMIGHKVLSKLDVGEFFIKVNHRFILEAMVAAIGGASQIKTICSSVDKLDKQPWSEIEEELVNTKNIPRESAQKLGEFVRFKEFNPDLNNIDLLNKILLIPELASNEKFTTGVEELKVLIKLCEDVDVTSIRFDPSLARGLDYYTGVIYEAVIPKALEGVAAEKGEKGELLPIGVGSVAAGGRYDGLVASFAPKSKVPCCGISFGIERLFAIKDAQSQAQGKTIRTNETDVIVIAAQKGLLSERRRIADSLRNAGVKVGEFLKSNPKFLNQMQYAEEREIPFAVIIGESELAAKVAKLRNVVTKDEREVPLVDLPTVLRSAIDASRTSQQ